MNLMNNRVPFNGLMLIMLAHYVIFAHIMGGFLIAMGMLTRFASILQIPVLIGAIIFINFSPEVWKPFSETILSIAVLLALIYFMVAGGGKWSFDYYLDRGK